MRFGRKKRSKVDEKTKKAATEKILRELESLSDRERVWACELEEAIYGDDTLSKARFQSSLAATNNKNDSTDRNSNNYHQSMGYSKPSTLQYGKPSDLEIVAHAIRAKGDTAKALHRMRRMKQFKDMYGIPDAFVVDTNSDSDKHNAEDDEEAKQRQERILQLLHKVFVTAYPNFIQRIGLDRHNRVVIQFRLCELRWTQPPPFNHSDEERFQAFYYLLNAAHPTLDQIRRGTVWVGDLEGIQDDVQQRPTSEIYKGGRLLLRDSYPIKVDDIPCVDCPSTFSIVYLGLYPFLSSHFLSKFVCVTHEMLQQHFPPELLSDRLQGKIKKKMRYGRRQQRSNDNNNNETGGTTRRGDTSSAEESDWENLNDDVIESDTNRNSKSKPTTTNNSNNRKSPATVKDSGIQDMWMTIERLSQMRFETERKFKL